MDAARSQRIGAIAGIVFTALFAVALLTQDTPDVKASGEEVIAAYKDGGSILPAILGMVIGAVLFMFFAGALRARLQGGGMDWLASVGFGGAAVYAAALGIFAMSQIALIDAADLNQPQVAQALNIIDNDNFFPAIIGLSVVMLATGWHIVATRALPVWIGWVAVVLGLAALAGPAGIAAFILFPLWVLAAAITLLRSAPVSDTTVVA